MEAMNPAVEYRASSRLPEGKYLVGKDGCIWSYHSRHRRWYKLRAYRHASKKRSGFTMMIHIKINGKCRSFTISHLVLSAFGDPEPFGTEYLHKNGDRTDCRLSNLQWVDKGTCRIGRPRPELKGKRSAAVLTEEGVEELRELRRQGYRLHELSEIFGISQAAASMAARGRTWENSSSETTDAWNYPKGSEVANAKLTENEVSSIRIAHASGEGPMAIAERLGVNVSTIHRIVTRKTWRHVV